MGMGSGASASSALPTPKLSSRAVNATSSGTFQTQLEHREFIVALIHLRIWVSEQLETWKKYGSVGNLEMIEETSAITSWKRFSVFLGIPMNQNLMVNYCEVTCSIILRPHSETRPFRKILWVRVRLCDFHQDQDVGRVIKVNFPFSNMKFRRKCDSHSIGYTQRIYKTLLVHLSVLGVVACMMHLYSTMRSN